MNTAYHDQYKAAERDARQGIARAARIFGVQPEPLDPSDPLSRAILDRIVGDPDRLRACRHIAQGPRPAIITAAEPGVVVCDQCFASPAYRKSVAVYLSTHDSCDTCGRPSGDYTEVTVRYGPIRVGVNVCSSCVGRT